ncbi:hypothetical protein BJ742DRAFT_766622 [Cladochytrium replicatum]|nr:hypothetical protein BJ742DRAFT_766622 [Cladochytrium replicatum]
MADGKLPQLPNKHSPLDGEVDMDIPGPGKYNPTYIPAKEPRAPTYSIGGRRNMDKGVQGSFTDNGTRGGGCIVWCLAGEGYGGEAVALVRTRATTAVGLAGFVAGMPPMILDSSSCSRGEIEELHLGTSHPRPNHHRDPRSSHPQEPYSRADLAASSVALVGVICIARPAFYMGHISGSPQQPQNPWGVATAIFCAIFQSSIFLKVRFIRNRRIGTTTAKPRRSPERPTHQ